MTSQSKRGAAATPHHQATAAAERCLAAGGNAVDAALAAASVLTVVYPNQTSIGGDLIALVGLPDGSAQVVHGIGRAPAALNHSTAGQTEMPLYGPLTVTVPGVVAAWHLMAERWGSTSIAGTLAAAADLAERGVPVAPGLARALQVERDRVMSDPGLKALLTRDGELLVAGDTLHQPLLATSLRAIARSGGEAFYRGEVAQSIVKTLQGLGSPVTLEDFAGHETTLVDPLSTTYGDAEYLTSPPPTQGAFFLESLAALEILRQSSGRSLDAVGVDARAVVRIQQSVAADRDELLADPDVTPLDIDRLLGARAKELAEGFSGATADAPRATGDTVAVVVADENGMWVSLIQSVFHAFGSGILDPGSGVVLHNRGAAFSLEPGSAALLTGGARPPHTLMPVLARSGGSFIGAHGVMGGRAQPQIHAHLALQLAAGATPHEAVARPRWVLTSPRDEGGVRSVVAEQDLPDEVLRRLRDDEQDVRVVGPLHDDVGHAQLVRATPSGLVAGTDPRADGASVS